MKKQFKLLALQVLITATGFTQPFQKSYTTGSFQNQENTKGYDAQPTLNGYTAFSETGTEKHLVLTDLNGVYQSALRFTFTQNNVVGEGSTFAELSNGDFFVAGILNGNMVLTSVNPAGVLNSYDTYSMSLPAAISEFQQIIQVEKYNDEYIYIRGIHKFQAQPGGVQTAIEYRHFLCQARRSGQPGNYQYSVQWLKLLGAGDVNITFPVINTDGKFGDMHVSKNDGSVYYVGKDLSNGSGNTHWDVQKFNINGSLLFWRRHHSGADDFEPTCVIEPSTGSFIYVCGFNNSQSFACRLNKNNGAQSWTTLYTPAQGFSGLKFRALDYSTISSNSYNLKVAGELRHTTKFAITTQLGHTSGTPFSLNAYYDFSSINEIVQSGTTNFIMAADKTAPFVGQPVNGIGLIKTDNNLNTNCSQYLAQPVPSIPSKSSYTLNYTTSLELIQIFTPEGNIPSMTYAEHSACCKLDQINQTVYLCPSVGNVVLDPGIYSAYFWNTGDKTRTLIATEPGTYYVTVFDENGCWGNIYYSVEEVPAIGLGVSPTPITCFGANNGNFCFTSMVNIVSANIVYPGSGGTQNVPINSTSFCFYNLIGLTSNPGLAPGFYSITAFDQYGCSETFTANLTEPTQIALSYTATLPTAGNCDAMLAIGVTGGTPPYVLNLFGPGAYFYSGAANVSLINLCSGCYTASVIDANGCLFNYPSCVAIPEFSGKMISAGVQQNEYKSNQLSAFPNPVGDRLTIKLQAKDTILVYNTLGKLVKNISIPSGGETTVYTGDLSPGVYLVRAVNSKSQLRVIKE